MKFRDFGENIQVWIAIRSAALIHFFQQWSLYLLAFYVANEDRSELTNPLGRDCHELVRFWLHFWGAPNDHSLDTPKWVDQLVNFTIFYLCCLHTNVLRGTIVLDTHITWLRKYVASPPWEFQEVTRCLLPACRGVGWHGPHGPNAKSWRGICAQAGWGGLKVWANKLQSETSSSFELLQPLTSLQYWCFTKAPKKIMQDDDVLFTFLCHNSEDPPVSILSFSECWPCPGCQWKQSQHQLLASLLEKSAVRNTSASLELLKFQWWRSHHWCLGWKNP